VYTANVGYWLRLRAILTVGAGVLGGCGEAGIGAVSQSVVGGTQAMPGEFAATGALVRGGEYRCTATLIAPDVILTAAHCLDEVGFGDFGFTLDSDLSPGVVAADVVPALVVHAHPSFDPQGQARDLGQVNDIGVVILERPVATAVVESLDVPGAPDAPDPVASGSELTLAGYGVLKWYLTGTVGIKRDAVVLVDQVQDYELKTVAADPEPCRGDSGGPLFVGAPESRRLTAVISRGVGYSFMCDNGAIATRVAPYLDWIADASADRDPGCSVAGGADGGGDGSGPFTVLLITLPVWLRALLRRRSAGSS
jgi:secreted trypsin-like serine protease